MRKCGTGKTEVFSTQIESLQTDLQPWAEKIAEKQAAIDLVANERDLLKEKTESAAEALELAEAAMEKLVNDREIKVRPKTLHLSHPPRRARADLSCLCTSPCNSRL